MYIKIDNRIYDIVDPVNKKNGYKSIRNIRTNSYLVYDKDKNKLENKVYRYDNEYLSNASFIDSGNGSFQLNNSKYITNKSEEFSDIEYKFDILEEKEKEVQTVINNIDKMSKELTLLLKTIYSNSEFSDRVGEINNLVDGITNEGKKL